MTLMPYGLLLTVLIYKHYKTTINELEYSVITIMPCVLLTEVLPDLLYYAGIIYCQVNQVINLSLQLCLPFHFIKTHC